MSNANEHDETRAETAGRSEPTSLTPPAADAGIISPDMYGSPMQPSAGSPMPQPGFGYGAPHANPYGAPPANPYGVAGGQSPYQGGPAPMYGQQMYPTGAPYPRMRMAQTGLGIAGFCTSIVGFFTWFSPFGLAASLAALVMSILGMRQVGAKGLAIAGIVISAISFVLALSFFLGVFALDDFPPDQP